MFFLRLAVGYKLDQVLKGNNHILRQGTGICSQGVPTDRSGHVIRTDEDRPIAVER